MAETRPLEGRTVAARPLSPHLQIYRPMLTMMMSIVHRITGFGNYFGMLLLAWWLIAAASPTGYARFQWFAGSLYRPADPVRLHLGGDPSHARRHPPSDLGYRTRLRPERARMAGRGQSDRLDRDHADPVGSSCCSSMGGQSMSDSEAHSHAAGARPRPRRGQIRHRTFLASAPDRGCRHSADHRGDHHHADAAGPQSGRRGANSRLARRRHHHAAVHPLDHGPHANRHGR